MYIICGKKLALCCATMSVWGIIQLTFMGILLYTHSVAFAEDLDIELEKGESITSFFTKAWGKYESAAHNCWIAVCIYILTFCASMSQYYFARKEAYGF